MVDSLMRVADSFRELGSLQGLRSPNEIADRDAQSGIFICHIHRIDLDQIAEILLERTLDEVLRGSGELAAVWRENQPKQAAAKVGTIDPFAGRGEKDLLDQVADVRVVIDFSRPAARVEVIWEINVHVAMTRGLGHDDVQRLGRSARRPPDSFA